MKKLSLIEIKREEEKRLIEQKEIAPQKKERYVKLLYLITSEGTKTEPNYFKGLRDELKLSGKFDISIEDIVIDGKGSPTTSLIKKTIRIRNHSSRHYDRVWAVFDKDDFNDFDDAIQLASNNNINCAWSNENFELWLLLHFKDVDTTKKLPRKKCVDLLENAICAEMKKRDSEATFTYLKGNPDIYKIVQDLGNESDAVRRAALLKNNFSGSSIKFSKQNPCTHVDELVNELRNPEIIAAKEKI